MTEGDETMGDVEFRIVTVPMLDTGLGREAGYEDDAALVAAAQAERAALAPDVREIIEKVDAELDRAFLYGT